MPKPKTGESAKDYIKRCMSDPKMKQDYPDNMQRYAVCINIYENEK